MADFNKVAQNVAEIAERVADASDAARGKGTRKGGSARWLILPAVAGVYAVAKNGSALSRTAKELAGQAKDRISEMPDLDLLGRVKEVAGLGDNNSQQEDETQPARRQPSSDAGQLEEHRRERAERRERRRKSTSAMS